ncbi:MAG: hypothetical protein K8W52_40175 [Deltaproteobacteria bacterium]|nr:hypothetical protein [Deltaproteobacteria bacterium]
MHHRARLGIALLLVAAACGKKAADGGSAASGSAGSGSAGTGSAGSAGGSAATPPPAPPDAAPVAATPPPCPTGEALTAKVTALYKLDAADLIGAPQCAAGMFPAPGWAIDVAFRVKTGDKPANTERVALLDATGAELFHSDLELPAGDGDVETITSFQAVDFNPDGTAELVTARKGEHRGKVGESVTIAKIDGTAWKSMQQSALSFDDTAAADSPATAEVCVVSWAIEGTDTGPRTLAIKVDAAKSKNCQAVSMTIAMNAKGEFDATPE